MKKVYLITVEDARIDGEEWGTSFDIIGVFSSYYFAERYKNDCSDISGTNTSRWLITEMTVDNPDNNNESSKYPFTIYIE